MGLGEASLLQQKEVQNGGCFHASWRAALSPCSPEVSQLSASLILFWPFVRLKFMEPTAAEGASRGEACPSWGSPLGWSHGEGPVRPEESGFSALFGGL